MYKPLLISTLSFIAVSKKIRLKKREIIIFSFTEIVGMITLHGETRVTNVNSPDLTVRHMFYIIKLIH